MNNIQQIPIKCELTMVVYDNNGKMVGEQIVTIPFCTVNNCSNESLTLDILSNYSDPLSIMLHNEEMEKRGLTLYNPLDISSHL